MKDILTVKKCILAVRKYMLTVKKVYEKYLNCEEVYVMLQHGMDSYIMITWYIGQARLFSFQPT